MAIIPEKVVAVVIRLSRVVGRSGCKDASIGAKTGGGGCRTAGVGAGISTSIVPWLARTADVGILGGFRVLRHRFIELIGLFDGEMDLWNSDLTLGRGEEVSMYSLGSLGREPAEGVLRWGVGVGMLLRSGSLGVWWRASKGDLSGVGPIPIHMALCTTLWLVEVVELALREWLRKSERLLSSGWKMGSEILCRWPTGV